MKNKNNIRKRFPKTIERIKKIFSTRENTRKLISIAKEYFKKKSYLSSFIVLISYIEFMCVLLLEAITRDKTSARKEMKSEYSIDIEKRLANYSLGRYTLGQLINFIEKENDGYLDSAVLEKLKNINKIRIKWIHLLAVAEEVSIENIEKDIKKGLENNMIFDFAESLYDLHKNIRRKTNEKLPRPRGIVRHP